MKKLVLVVSIASLLVACSDNKQNQNYQQPYPQQAAPAYIQQPVVQPQVVASPAPVVVNQQDNTMMNMATGALLGHVISNAMTSNDRPVERVVEHKTVIIDNRQPNVPTPNKLLPLHNQLLQYNQFQLLSLKHLQWI
jgi:hypothetical protein